MSEAITKACYDCDGTGRDRHDFTRTKCVECDGTGRVPDVEATLRAQLDAALAEVMRLTEGLSRQMLARDADVERLADELTALQEEMKDRERESEEVARLTAEVERLKEREEAAKPLIMAIREDGNGVVFCPCCWKYWTKDASGCADGCPRSAWLAGCKS